MISCPNKSSQEWKDLVSKVGENLAYLYWDEQESNPELFLSKTKKPSEYYKDEITTITQFRKQLGIGSQLSPLALSKARKRLGIYNFKYQVSHRLEAERIGQSNTFKTTPILSFSPPRNNRKMKAISNQYMNLDESNDYMGDVDKETFNKSIEKLEKILTNIGVTTNVIQNLREKYGQDVNGVADVVRKIIDITDKEFLPEEASHIIINMLEDKQREALFNLAKQSKIYSKEYSIYSKDKNYQEKDGSSNDYKIIEEVAGKLLANAFVHNSQNPVLEESNESETFIRRMLKMAEVIWNKIQAYFKEKPHIEQQINEAFTELAINIYNNKAVLESKNKSLNNVFFSKKSNEIMNKSKNSQDILENSIKVLKSKVENLEKTTNEDDLKANEYISKRKELIAKLQSQLETKDYIKGIYNFLNVVQSELIGKENKEGSRIEHINLFKKKLNEIEERIDKGTNLNAVSKDLHEVNIHYEAYNPIIKKLVNSISNDKELRQEIVNAFEGNEEKLSELETNVNLYNGQLQVLNDNYIRLTQKQATKIIDLKSGEKDLQKDSDGILKSLKVAFEDEGKFSRWMNSMGESVSTLLRTVDSIVKDAILAAQQKTIKTKVDLLNEWDKVKDKVDQKRLHETHNGKITGYFIDKYNRGKWQEAANKFFDKIGKRPKDGTDLKLWKQQVSKWFNENGRLTRNGTFIKPSSKYLNEEFKKLTSTESKYLETLKTLKNKQDKGLPKNKVNKFLLPQFRKDFIERLKKDPKNIGNTLLDDLKEREDDTEFGNNLLNEIGEEIKFLPLYGNSRIENPDVNLSTDITSNLIRYAHITNTYKEMNKIVHTVELMKDVIVNRKTISSKANITPEDYKNMSSKELLELGHANLIDGDKTLALARLESYLDMVVYGKKKKKDQTFGFWKKGYMDLGSFGKINMTKLVDKFGKYTALNSLAFNVFAGINNVTLGRLMTNMEGITGEYFDVKNLYAADAKIFEAKLLGDIGKKVPNSKAIAWLDTMDVMQDFDSSIMGVNADRKTKLSQLMTSNAFFFMSHVGEFQIQMRTSIGLASSIKLKNDKGETVNLYDAFVNEKGHLKMNGKFTISESNRLFGEERIGTELTNQDVINFQKMSNRINNKLHGIYNNTDKSAIQQGALGRLAMMFRKFLVPAINRRFGTKKFNEDLNEYDEGFYREMGTFLHNLVKDTDAAKAQFLAMFNKDNVDEDQLQNMYNLRRSFLEIGVFVALGLVLNLFLNELDVDDDDEWALNMFIYQANRLYTEIAAFVPTGLTQIDEGFRLLKSPAAAINQAEQVTDFLSLFISPFDSMEEFQSGKYKGWTRWQKETFEIVPFQSTIKGWFHPAEKVKYFK